MADNQNQEISRKLEHLTKSKEKQRYLENISVYCIEMPQAEITYINRRWSHLKIYKQEQKQSIANKDQVLWEGSSLTQKREIFIPKML